MEKILEPYNVLTKILGIFFWNLNFWLKILLIFIFSISCTPKGKLYKWCEKRNFPPICEKFLKDF